MFLGAGLVLSGCGDDDTATTPAPAPPPPPPPAPEPEPDPEPAAPEAPATPTGLHVDETTETSIEWHWNAVEGAIGYAVQVSMNEMFDATDKIVPTVETHYTESDLEPETSVYLRVAAAAGTLEEPILSDWSTHVTGMSAMPPPPPPPAAPAALEVTFSPPEGKYPMVPDDGTVEATAMASVNTKMTVSSNAMAVITPMFVEDAASVTVMEGDDSMPFAYVDWSMLQADVISDGATFMIQRATVGANQEMEPTGDVAYVTCGPFRCAEGSDAPEFGVEDSGACEGWDPTLELQIGFVDNTVLDVDGDGGDGATEGYNDGDNTNDGADIGWSYTSSQAMTVKHHFSGVTNGSNFTASGPDAGKASSATPLSMAIRSGTSGVDDATADTGHQARTNARYRDALNVSARFDTDATNNRVVCAEALYENPVSGLHEPDECFRIRGGNVDRFSNYLDGYSVELTLKDAGVSWGEVPWEEDPFEDLKCDSMTFVASDQVDVCAMFEDEVDQALAKDWGTRTFTLGQQGTVDNSELVNLRAARPSSAKPDRFGTLWFDHDFASGLRAKGSSSSSPPVADLYATDADTPAATNLMLTLDLLDGDGDPAYGDFGKVDFNGADGPDSDTFKDDPDGVADNYAGDDARRCSDVDGPGCDAEFTIEKDVVFGSGTFGCHVTRTVTISCEWDADGEMTHRPNTTGEGADTHTFAFSTTAAALTAQNDISDFAKCTVKN